MKKKLVDADTGMGLFTETLQHFVLSVGPKVQLSGLLILSELMRHDGRTQEELSAATGLPKYTVSKCVRSCEAEGLVVCERPDENRRLVVVSLSSRGRQVKARVLSVRRVTIARMRRLLNGN